MIKIYPKVVLLFLFISMVNVGYGQRRTVGLITNLHQRDVGYTLLYSLFNGDAYLIDDCGYAVHKWEFDSRPGATTYLQADGSVLRSEYDPESTFYIGGVGGIVRKTDWNGNDLWTYKISNDTVSSHHDVYEMSNGNVLVLVWHKRQEDEVLAAGRNDSLYHSMLVSEEVWELKPIGTDSAEVVWKWNSWDHIVQDHDETKPHYGDATDVHKIDLNYAEDLAAAREWQHMNSLEYDEVNDLVILSVRHFHEVWIIDHSTTKEESATSQGGRFGKGGDLLFRYGNPIAHHGAGDQKLYGQHDVRVMNSSTSKLDLKLFNNGVLREPQKSTVDILEIPLSGDAFETNSTGEYVVDHHILLNPDDDTFYSSITSGSEFTGDSTLMVTLGMVGRIEEYDLRTKKIIWKYISPITGSGSVAQGDDPVSPDPTTSNTLFKANWFPEDFSAFTGNQFNIEVPYLLEKNPYPDNCEVVLSENSLAGDEQFYSFRMNMEHIFFTSPGNNELVLYDLEGRIISNQKFKDEIRIDRSKLQSGIVIGIINNYKQVSKFKIIN